MVEIEVWPNKKKEIIYTEKDIFKYGQLKKNEWIIINTTSDVQVKCKSEEECIIILEASINYLDNEDDLLIEENKFRKKIISLVS